MENYTSQAMATGIWSPLDPTRRQIRLAYLMPSNEFNEQPSCSLRIVSLDEDPRYEALSYTWGDPNVTVPIQLWNINQVSKRDFESNAFSENVPDSEGVMLLDVKDLEPPATETLGQEVSGLSISDKDEMHEIQWPVTTNLETALRYLRHDSVERILWIDSICIDQSSIEERNHQVPFMKTIYSNALAVQIWLGSPTPESDDAIHILKEMGQGVALQDIRIHDRLINEDDLQSVIALNMRPWWDRTWVQQEVLLARKALFHCGFRFFEWGEILSVADFNKMISSAMKSLRFDDEVLDNFIDSFDATSRLFGMAEIQKDPKSTDEDYVSIISSGRSCRNSDERDAIYGFLGLLSDNIASKIKPDYNISASEVFRDAAVQLTLCSKSLIIFSLVHYAENKDRGMPTWVPSWHALGDNRATEEWVFRSNRLVQHDQFSSCGKHSLKFELYDPRTSKLRGARFDIVSKRGKALELFGETLGGAFRKIQEWKLLRLSDGVKYQSKYIAGGSAEEAFWRTLLNDLYTERSGPQRRCQSEDHRSYVEWLDELENTTETFWESERANSFHISLSQACFDRRFFITKKGYFGIGPAELEEGDQIYILAGGKHPFALRQLSEPRLDTFELIGDCYVHGIMDGEAVSEKTPSWETRNGNLDDILSASEPNPDLPLCSFHDVFVV